MREDLDDRLDRFESQIGELRGHLTALEAQVGRLLGPGPEKHSGLKTAFTFITVAVVPILVAIIGGYFALRAAGLR